MLTPRRRWLGWSSFCVAPAELVWAGGRRRRCRVTSSSARVGIDLAADEARTLLPDAVPVDGPVPVGDEPGGLLRSAEQLLRRVTTAGAGTGLHVLRAQVADLVGGEHK